MHLQHPLAESGIPLGTLEPYLFLRQGRSLGGASSPRGAGTPEPSLLPMAGTGPYRVTDSGGGRESQIRKRGAVRLSQEPATVTGAPGTSGREGAS